MKIAMLAVGISQYASPEIDDLTVCHDDAAKMVAAFRALAPATFVERILLNEQATKASIAAAIAWLAESVGAADLAVFYYSGHGASFEDDGSDEADKAEEFLCPHDCGLTTGVETFIRDDELRQWLSAVSAKTTRLVTILDSCHSGTATMASSVAIAKEIPSAVVSRLIGADRRPKLPKSGEGPIPGQILLAGCQDSEQAFILIGAENSLFTTELIKGLQNPTITTFQDLFAYARAAIEDQADAAGIVQNPNLVDGSASPLAFR